MWLLSKLNVLDVFYYDGFEYMVVDGEVDVAEGNVACLCFNNGRVYSLRDYESVMPVTAKIIIEGRKVE